MCREGAEDDHGRFSAAGGVFSNANRRTDNVGLFGTPNRVRACETVMQTLETSETTGIRRWLEPPVFTDRVATSVAAAIYTIGLYLAGAAAVWMLLAPFVPPGAVSRIRRFSRLTRATPRL